MAFQTQVGLGLLLCPLNSSIVLRTACCSAGLVLPVYSTFKAIENKDQNEQHRWLLYWAAYGSFSVAETFTEKVLSWFPLYYQMKFAFFIWLQLPTINGAKQLYASHLRPFLLKHQARMDLIVEFVYGELSKFVSAHRAELHFARSFVLNALARESIKRKRAKWSLGMLSLESWQHYAAEAFLFFFIIASNQMVRSIIQPVKRESNRIEGPKRQVQGVESKGEN